MTTYQSSFSRNQENDTLSQTVRERDLRQKPAGGKRFDENKIGGKWRLILGTKMTSVLTGEQYRDFEDPQHNTHCQRTWVYGGDSTVALSDKGLRRTLEAMGGSASPEAVIAMFRQSKNPRSRIGDGPTTLPIESKIFFIIRWRERFLPNSVSQWSLSKEKKFSNSSCKRANEFSIN